MNDSIRIQRQMVADMNQTREGGRLGWDHRGFTDPTTGQPLTLAEMFDNHAVCLAVCLEFGDRMPATDGLIRWGK